MSDAFGIELQNIPTRERKSTAFSSFDQFLQRTRWINIVRIKKGDVASFRRVKASIACRTRTLVFAKIDDTESGVTGLRCRQHRSTVVLRAVVYRNNFNFQATSRLFEGRCQRQGKPLARIEDRYDNADINQGTPRCNAL